MQMTGFNGVLCST